MTTLHRLRTKPIGELSSEDLRILIGQQIGLRWLIPLGIEVLESNPLASGDLYSGDLLVSVLRTPIEFWSRAPEWHDRLKVLVDSMVVVPADVSEDMAKFRARST